MKVGRSSGEDGRIVSPEAFEAAFRMHYVPVYRFIAGRVGPALAEDLAAETFATAYRRRASVLIGFPAAEHYLGFDGHPSNIYVRTQNTPAATNSVDAVLGAQADPQDRPRPACPSHRAR